VPDSKLPQALVPLRRRLEEEEAAYARALAELDRLSGFALPEEEGPELLEALAEVNAAAPAEPPVRSGLAGVLGRRFFDALRGLSEHQARVDGALVRLLNLLLSRQARLNGSLRALAAGIVGFAQRVDPVMDARDQLRVAEAPSDAHLVLEAFARRIEAAETRSEALLALRDRVEIISEELRSLRDGLAAAPPAPVASGAALRAGADSVYTAFENRFRGERGAVRSRQADYLPLFRGQAPVLDLGCGRGEFLDLLRAEGIAARGVDGNANAVRECRARGLDVALGDLVTALRDEPRASLGGAFAAQVVEHLPPKALAELLAAAYEALRPGGLLVLETVNAASGLAFLDVFIRDLTHERPLHPETLRFMAAAAGFNEARIELRSPVPDDVRLALLPSGALPPPATKVLNENLERLNALLFAPVDYALIARR
jgi:SAM-dependent methyltransferase